MSILTFFEIYMLKIVYIVLFSTQGESLTSKVLFFLFSGSLITLP